MRNRLKKAQNRKQPFTVRPLFSRAYRNFSVMLGAFMISFVVSALIGVPAQTNAEDLSAVIAGTTYTLSVTSQNDGEVNMNIAPTSAAGTEVLAKDSLLVYTNAENGFQLMLSTSDANLNRTLESDSWESTIGPAGGTYAAPAALENNTWGYALLSDTSKGLGTDSGFPSVEDAVYTLGTQSESLKYAKIPTTSEGGQVIQDYGHMTGDAGMAVDVYYGVKANTNIPDGTYTGTITYTALAEGGSEDMGGIEKIEPATLTTAQTPGRKVKIYTTVFTTDTNFGTVTARVGNNDCNSAEASVESSRLVVSCDLSGGAYSAGVYGVDITIGAWNNRELSNSAVLTVTAATTPTLQTFTAANCSALGSVGASARYEDSRDGKTYRVSKLADGNCWMTENLALDGGRTITSGDSNTTDAKVVLPANSDATFMNVWDTPMISSNGATTTDSYGSPYGNLYNWNAATARTGERETTGTVTTSICPKGWRLPDNTGAYSYSNLMDKSGLSATNTTNATYVTKVQQSPLYFPLADAFRDVPRANAGHNANYWSRTVHSTTDNAYNLNFNADNGNFNPQNNNNKFYGFSVRCVFGS